MKYRDIVIACIVWTGIARVWCHAWPSDQDISLLGYAIGAFVVSMFMIAAVMVASFLVRALKPEKGTP